MQNYTNTLKITEFKKDIVTCELHLQRVIEKTDKTQYMTYKRHTLNKRYRKIKGTRIEKDVTCKHKPKS